MYQGFNMAKYAHITLFFTIITAFLASQSLSEAKVELYCDRITKSFAIKVIKNEWTYVEIFAKDHETETGCKTTNGDASVDHFFFNVSSDRCGATYDASEDFYHIRVYVAGQAVVLTARDSLYDASCSFNAQLYTVNTTNDQYASPNDPNNPNGRTRSDNQPNEPPSEIQRANITEENPLDELQLKVYNANSDAYTTTANVGDPIRLVLILNSTASFLPRIDYSAECFLYSNESKMTPSEYKLTTNQGCSADSNALFEGPIEEVRLTSNMINSDEYGLQTPEFGAPYYQSTGKLYFECMVELCSDQDNTCGGKPQCSQQQRSFDYDNENDYYYWADGHDSSWDEENYQPSHSNQKKSRKISNVVYVYPGPREDELQDGRLTKMSSGYQYRQGSSDSYSGTCTIGSKPYIIAFFISTLVIVCVSAVGMALWTKIYLKNRQKQRIGQEKNF